MKNKLFTYGKKSLAIVMTVMMLMSCWVFMPATHEHLTAEAASDATAEYNKSLVNSLSAIDTSVTTMYGSFEGDTQYVTNEYYSQVYKNVLHTSQVTLSSTPAAQWKPDKWKDSNPADRIAIWHPTTVLLYDGVTTPEFGVVLEVDAADSKRIRSRSAYISANANGLAFKQHWKGYVTGRLEHMFLMFNSGATDHITSDGTAVSGLEFNTASGGWYFLANDLRFTGSMGSTEYLRTINPTYGYIGMQASGDSWHTLTGSSAHSIYVINYNPVKTATNQVNTLLQEIKNNPGQYTTASVKAFVNLYNKMAAAHPNKFASSTVCDPNGYNNAATAAMSAYNSFNLEKRTYDVTYENMFSISDWRNSASSNYNTAAGEVLVENNNTIKIYKSISGSELTTSSSYSGNHQATMYSMPVVAGEDYTVSFNITSSANGTVTSEFFLFWFDVNGNPVYNTAGNNTFNNASFTGNGVKTATFTAPANATQAEIRFDNDCAETGSTIRFNNIAVYPAARGTEQEISSWTNRVTTQAFAYGANASGTLNVPVRKNYTFNGWYEDSNANGVKDSGEAVTDASGAITATLTANVHHNLNADWLPVTQDVGYDNLFSLSKWAMSDSSNSSNTGRGNVVYDLDNGTITVNTTKDGEVYTTYGAAASHYQIAVEPNTEYIFEADMNLVAGTQGQMFVFFYKADGSGVTGAVYNGTAQGNPHIGIYPASNGTYSIRFTTPADCTKMAIRVGASTVGTTATYSNIGFYKTSSYDAYAKDYVKVREPFTVGKAESLFAPTRDGYVFNGWELADGTKITTTEDLDESTTVYATWTKEWTVTYYHGDSLTVLATVKVKDGETVGTLPTVAPTKASDNNYSYEFNYWYANSAEFKADTVITADVKVFPIFNNIVHSNFSYTLQKASTCTENAIVIKKCIDCNHNFGEVTYNPAEDANAASHTAWLAKGHSYTGGILDGSSTGNTDNDTHSIKCARYSVCGSVELVKHVWAEKGTDGATCTTPGTVHWSCACGAEKTTTGSTAPDVHNYDLTTGTPNGDSATHTVKCTYNNAHTMSVACTDEDKNCVCDICGQELVHNYNKQTKDFVAVEADCYKDAVYYYTCQCGKKGTETWTDTGSMLAHNWTDTETYPKSAADCENDAVYYKECSLCHISSQGVTDATWTKANTATGHAYTGTIRDNKNGTHSYLCANGCATYGYNGVKEASTGCTYGAWSKTEADTHTKTCSECGYSVTEDHSWSAWTSTDEGKNAAGQHTHSCTVCGRVDTADCSYTDVETKNTCTEDGYTTYTCSVCGHDYVTAGATKTGHKYTGEVKSLNDGTHYYLCVNGCGTYGFEEVENATTTCTYGYKNNKDGEHQVTCTACKYTFTEECSGGQATCTAPATCEKCKTAYGATAPHSFTGTAVKLDGDKHAYLCEYCSTEGLYGVGATQGATQDCSGGTATCTTLAVCDVCKDTHGKLDADAHDWGKWTNIAGTETHQRVCGYNADHTEEGECFSPDIVVVDPDCETAGYTLNTCDLCGHEWQTNPTDPLGHYWSAWVNNNDGTHTRTCLDETCKYGENGGAKAETADCTEANATAAVTEPTCTEQGYTTYTCKDCGYEWVADYVNATGHHFTKQTKKTDSKYQRSTKDCVTDWTYWYCCDACDVSAETEKDNYENEADLYWVREAAAGHKYDAKTTTEDYLATAATCTAKATYYYSCSVCGASSKDTADEKTFEYGSVLNHDWQDTETFLKSEADCINNEVYYKECSRCHISSENETGATWEKADTKSGHVFNYEGGYTEGVEANCTDTGVVEHYTCKTCGKHFKADKVTEIAADKLVIAKLGHDYEDVPAKAATCEEAGYTKHKQCQREDCLYRNTDYKVIAALGHEFKAENGYFCDTVYNYHAYYCSRYDNCGAYGVDNVKYSVDSSGLDPEIRGGIKCDFTGEYVNYEDANGVHSHKLTCVCGNVSSAVCADEAPVHVLPTCTEAGYYIHTCDVCGFVWEVASDAEEDKPLDHDYTNAVWTKVEGKDEHTRKCNRCDVTETESCYTNTPATTCGEKNICHVCKEEFGTQIEHAWTQVKDEKYLLTPAACGVNAVYYKVCANCGECEDATQTWTDEGSALKHVMVEFADEDSLRYKTAGVWKYDNAFGYDLSKWAGKPADFDESTIFEPTCKNDGRAISYCTREGCDHYVTKTASKVDDGHIWGDETTVGGNCATGITIRTECTLCGKTTTRVETVEHTYVLHTYVPATCDEASLEYFVCSVCGDDKEEHKDEALGHDWATDVIEKEATCGQTGRKYSICSRCNAASEKTEIPRLNHVWDMDGDGITDAGFTPDMLNYDDGLYVEASEATCQFEGYAGYYKCFKCSYDQHLDEEWRKNNITEKKDHVDGNDDGKCDECNTKIYGEDGDKNCDCICHKDGWFSKIIYKILRFFWKLFGIGKSCDCGNVHY